MTSSPSPTDIASYLSAAEQGNEARIKQFLDLYPAHVDACDENEQTALMNAARNGKTNIVKMLWQEEADILKRDKNNCSAYGHARQYELDTPYSRHKRKTSDFLKWWGENASHTSKQKFLKALHLRKAHRFLTEPALKTNDGSMNRVEGTLFFTLAPVGMIGGFAVIGSLFLGYIQALTGAPVLDVALDIATKEFKVAPAKPDFQKAALKDCGNVEIGPKVVVLPAAKI